MRAAALLLVSFIPAAYGHPDGPPPGHTGGFGEPNCHACHFDGPLVIAYEQVRLSGLPARFVAGTRYELTLELVEPVSPAAGFQLSVRDSVGRQAGRLAPLDETTAMGRADGIEYLAHSGEGTRAGTWRFEWRAPNDPVPQVQFNAALTAANDDGSEFGDQILLFEVLTTMERGR